MLNSLYAASLNLLQFAVYRTSPDDMTGLLFCCCIGGFYGLIFLVGILSMVFWIWMLVEAATKEPSEGNNDKVVWILVIALTHLIGALIYYFVRRPERKRKYGI